jgi:hypothetical protein
VSGAVSGMVHPAAAPTLLQHAALHRAVQLTHTSNSKLHMPLQVL